ncbi:DUF917 domain-containing protein [Microbulbifer agarilyticus]|uniref:DUF917 domain-containing protein n=1 Tax=Microbulbifer agarilyticus TaxID=260552 RepID=UPI001C951681|nr:DUF917 domain-containing protein [Microbulbifer agarilyticus]MBY6190603.1 DUF917 domain-containing protein [Microbulbifer agarilyticus]
MRVLTRQNLQDILYGCAILGTGGGGELDEGFELIDEALALGKEFVLADPSEIPDEAMICTPYMLGAISELPAGEEDKYARLPTGEVRPILAAYQRMEAYKGTKFSGTVACELGGSNTAMAFYVAAMTGGYIVDGDPAGRAVPEITHSTYYLNDLPAAPIVTANAFGECMVIENVVDDLRAEEIVRALSMASGNDIAAVDHALCMQELRGALIGGTITKALELGRTWRATKADGGDIAANIAAQGGGEVVFRGAISTCDWKTAEGFTLGNISISGDGDYAGSDYAIWLKNENMIAWRNGEVHATIPDLICLLDMETGEPVTNPNYRVDQKVAVVVLPAPNAFLSEKGLEIFGPKYLGYSFEYRSAVA